MVRILTFNAPPKLEKKLGKENPLKLLWESFRSLDRFTKGFIVTALLLILITPYIVNHYLNYLQQAQQPNLPKEGQQNVTKETEFFSNEVLIRVKKEARGKVREGKPLETGIASLDKLNGDNQVTKFERVTKPSKKSKNPDHEIFAWYKITLSGKRETVKVSSKQTIKDLADLRTDKIHPQLKKLGSILVQYQKDPNIEKVELNYIVKALQVEASPSASASATPSATPEPTSTPSPTPIPSPVPNDPYYSSSGSWGQPYDDLWGLKKIQAQGAWGVTTGSGGVIVAVSDTGIDYNHEDLADNIWKNPQELPANGIDDDGNGYVDDVSGWDFYNSDNDPLDDDGHGTHVAGTIGAVGNNGLGIVGVNWRVSLMAVKFLSADGSGSESDGAASIRYAADMGASVINMSWGGAFMSQLLEDALSYAAGRGVVLVAAAGNSTNDAMNFSPANSPYVITVSAAGAQDQQACFTSFGSKIDVSAPGGDSPRCGGANDFILSARAAGTDMYLGNSGYNPGDNFVPKGDPQAKYYLSRGTSMAAPHVVGASALIKSLHPDFTPEEIRQVLRQGSDDVAGGEWDFVHGYGRLNAARALMVTAPPPVAKIITPKANSIVGRISKAIGTVSSRGLTLTWLLEVGEGQEPTAFTIVKEGTGEIIGGELGTIDLSQFASGPITIRLVVSSANGYGEDRVVLRLEKDAASGWPQSFGGNFVGVTYASDPAVADLNGDGKKDFIVVGTFDLKVYAWQIDGTAVPGWPAALPDIFSAAPAVGDLDRDGKPEVVVSSWGWGDLGYLSVYRADGTMYPGWPKSYNRAWSFTTPALFDLNADGKKEIIYRNCGIHVYRIDGSELPGWPQFKGFSNCSDWLNSPSVADLDGDGQWEILVHWRTYDYKGEEKIYVFESDGSIKWTANVPYGLGVNLNPAVADLDGDGRLEVAIQTTKNLCAQFPTTISCFEQTVYVFRHDGSAYPGFPKIFTSSTGDSPLIIADLDGDGRAELILPGAPRLKVINQNGEEVSTWQVPVAQNFASPTVGDFDGDGKPEIFVGGDDPRSDFGPDQNQGIYVVKEGAGIIWEREYGRSEAAPVAGDFDGDGQLEIAGAMDEGSGYYFYVWDLSQKVKRRGYAFWEQLGFNAAHTREFIFRPLYGSGPDTDWDDWSDSSERYIGTDISKGCPVTTNAKDEDPDAWPPDFDDNRKVDVVDVSVLRLVFNSRQGDGKYNRRFDLNADGKIDIIDLAVLGRSYYGKTCTN